jgi:Domain of unknown function (DUF1833)
MTDTTLTQALKEAYAAAPSNVVIYHTLEFRHPAFTTPIRVVRDVEDLTATLEASAPQNPSTAVNFQRFAFDFSKPEVSSSGVPQIQIEIDNVDRAIVANIELALQSTDLIKVTYREFISTDLSAPQNNPPLHLTVMSISATPMRVTATAGYPDLINRKFPTKAYDADIFKGLTT